MKVIEVARHRNGISGEPFYAILFTAPPESGEEEEKFIATLFDEPGQCAVIGLDRIEGMGVTMARGNSWRGDHYETELRKYCKQYEKRVNEAISNGQMDAIEKAGFFEGSEQNEKQEDSRA